MQLPPETTLRFYRPASKLEGKVAIITGGDPGIGRAVALAYAMEGADIAIFYNEHDDDAEITRALVEQTGLTLRGDVRDSEQCRAVVSRTIARFGKLDILVNNAAYQMFQKRFEDISEAQFL